MISKKKMIYKVFQDPHYFLAFGFGSGLLPKAPGTWGTLAAIPTYLLLSQYSTAWYLFFCFISFLYGCYCCQKVSNDLQVHDYKGIVWDEIVGYWLTMVCIPTSLTAVLLGFVLFRIFDIIKPPPIRWVDKKVQGGVGIMLDDVLAAIPAWCILYAIHRLGIL